MKRALPALLLALASVAAWANPSGHKWFTFPHYRVFAHTTINGMPAGSFTGTVLPGVQNSFITWTKTKVACTSWVSTYDGTFNTPTGTAAVNGNDNLSRVIWLGGSQWRYPQATLGLTSTVYFQGSGEITDADMEMNDNVPWANNGNFNSYDYESVVTHEAGHFLGLDHSPDTNAVMYASIANGQVKRTLTTTDLNDVCGVYPGSGMPGSQGSPCTMNTQCATGLVCRAPASAAASKICTKDCTSGQACPTNLVCAADSNGGTSKACFTPAGPADYCKFCIDGTNCSSGLCLRDSSGHNWCSNTCSPTAACAAGSSCIDSMTGGGCSGANQCVCAPPAFKCTSQCTTAANCGASGYSCVSGTCEATGNNGDRCEVSEYCKDCKVCVGSSQAAYCRACCNGGADYCTTSTGSACTNTTCGAGETCLGLNMSQSAVCAPSAGADVCTACSATVACANGASCLAGRCHTSCNPTNPGGCTACLDQGGGVGVCACADEQARENDPCGVISPTQFFACVTGLVCDGSPKKCHRPCDVLNPSSCPSGQTCQQGTSGGICVAGSPGATCAACSGGTGCNAGNSCVQGVCRQTCNVAVKPGPCDDTCVDVGGGVNVCACGGEISTKGGFCGPNPIHACQAGLSCINNVCVGPCDPNTVPVDCPLGTECRLLAGTNMNACQPPDYGTGGGSGGGSSGAGGGTTGAGGGGTIDGPGCGCSGIEAGLWPMLGLLSLLRARRRRS